MKIVGSFTATDTAPGDYGAEHLKLLGTAKFDIGGVIILDQIKVKYNEKTKRVWMEFPFYKNGSKKNYYHKVVTPNSYRILLATILPFVEKAWKELPIDTDQNKE